jgi:hypothetical protein
MTAVVPRGAAPHQGAHPDPAADPAVAPRPLPRAARVGPGPQLGGRSADGDTRVPGIRAETDHVVIQGFVSDGAQDTGIWAAGTNVSVQDNTIT